MEGHKQEMLDFYGFWDSFEETKAMIPSDDKECFDISQAFEILAEEYFLNASKGKVAAEHLRITVEKLNKDLEELKEKIAEKSDMNNSEKSVFVVTLLPKIVDVQHDMDAYSSSLNVNLDKIQEKRDKVKDVIIKYRMCAEHNYNQEENMRI